MANKLYHKGAEKTLGKLIDWSSDDIRVVAVSSSYVVDLANHEFYSDLSGILCTGVALTSLSIAGGVFDADDVNLTLTAGTVKALVIYKYNATPSLAALLAYEDSILGFPKATAGGNLPIVWPSTGIVSLTGG